MWVKPVHSSHTVDVRNYAQVIANAGNLMYIALPCATVKEPVVIIMKFIVLLCICVSHIQTYGYKWNLCISPRKTLINFFIILILTFVLYMNTHESSIQKVQYIWYIKKKVRCFLLSLRSEMYLMEYICVESSSHTLETH